MLESVNIFFFKKTSHYDQIRYVQIGKIKDSFDEIDNKLIHFGFKDGKTFIDHDLKDEQILKNGMSAT
jgi:hypothetical protein